MDVDLWSSLSRSSRSALQYAWAVANERGGASPSGYPRVDSYDLLVGILLAHPGTSEAEVCLRHFGLTAGQVMAPDVPTLTPMAVNAQLARLPGDVPPDLDHDADVVMREAVSLGTTTGEEGIVELRAVFAALLQTSNAASTGLRRLLTEAGVDAQALTDATTRWVASGADTPYEALLADYVPRPTDVVNFKADHGASAFADDHLGIGPEVDAFAFLLASRTLRPPLAIGLFGNWGSGKSFFMEAVSRRITAITDDPHVRRQPQHEVPFWKQVVQVRFNAWHYLETDLWASLVHHIFDQLLFAAEGRDDDAVEERQRYLLRELDLAEREVATLESEAQEAERLRRDAAARLVELEASAATTAAALESERTRDIAVATVKEETARRVRAATPSDGGPSPAKGAMTIADAAVALTRAAEELSQGRIVLSRAVGGRSKGWVWVAIALFGAAVLAGSALVAWVVGEVAESSVAAALSGLVPVVTGIAAVLAAGARWMHDRLDALDAARTAVDQDRHEAEAARAAQITALEQKLRDLTAAAEAARRVHAAAADKLMAVRGRLDMTPEEVLFEFLHEVADARTYEQRLGLHHQIRRNFKQLADFIEFQNAHLEQVVPPAGAQRPRELLDDDDPRVVNRIILYIDDLDRCPDHRVIEVLQAVHMLLAFPLFVVVVAVDARWMAHALATRFPALSDGTGAGRAGPADYLEKIFQIPFWVRPLDDGGRQRVVRGLLAGHIRFSGGDVAGAGEPISVRVEADGATVLAEMLRADGAPSLWRADALTVSDVELRFLESLCSLAGETPRSMKRFVNVYQLVKILTSAGRGAGVQMPPDEEVAALLLAMSEGGPALARSLSERARTATGGTLGSLVAEPDSPGSDLYRRRLQTWLAARPDWAALPVARLAAAATHVDRFRFDVDGGPAEGVSRQFVHLIGDTT